MKRVMIILSAFAAVLLLLFEMNSRKLQDNSLPEIPEGNYIYQEEMYLDDIPLENVELTEETVYPPEESSLSFSDLKKKNSDLVGILFIENCWIDEPVVLSKDDYYLRKNFYRNDSKGGTAYIKNCTINSQNVTVYHHSSRYDEKYGFTLLKNYKSYDFWNDNRIITFVTADEIRTYEIFSVVVISADSGEYEFTQSSWRNKEEFQEYIDKMISESIYDTEAKADSSDRLLTLVTCNINNLKQSFIISAKLIGTEQY